MIDNKVKFKQLPDVSGIYLFYNSAKELIYVGKATSLKNRIKSYFSDYGLRTTDYKRPIEVMVHEISDIKTIQTDSVLEAIILEANTIKKFQPKYNVMLKDDKSWNYIVITKDLFPRVEMVRQHELDVIARSEATKQSQERREIAASLAPLIPRNDRYVFGPYPGLKTKEMMKLLRKLFYVSTCKPCKPCFYYQLGQCLGVCTGEISPSDYKKKVIKPLVQFLSGKKKNLLKNLNKEMKLAAKNHEFEEAGRLRDQIKQLNRIQDIALLNKSFVESSVIARSEVRATKQSQERREIASSFTSFIPRNDMRVEGYDISNLGATGKVGSMVVFENSEPNKSQYRKFKIKTVSEQSDVDCLAEVLDRRLRHNEWKMPNIILVDGGLPQVHKVHKVIKSKSLVIPVVGIAKGSERKKNEFILGDKSRDFIKWVNENRNLLIQVRDEAHRFAIKYQRSLRKIK